MKIDSTKRGILSFTTTLLVIGVVLMFFSIISGIWMFVSCFGAASKFVPILIGGGIGTIVSGVVSYYVFKGVAYCIEGFAASLELQMDTRDAVEKLVEDKVKEQ